MKRTGSLPSAWILCLGAAILGAQSGCSSVPTHDVAIDAISDGPPKFSGVSYRLLARDPVLAREVVEYNLALTCLNAALAGRGMYPSSGNSPPDLLIEVDFGEAPMLVLPGTPRTHELYVQLSARRYRAELPARNFRGEELWNVRVSLKEINPALERVIPLLIAVATDYAGTEHQPDNTVEVADSSPTVVAIKNAVTSSGGKPGS
jgi:hypothetical protein